LNGKEEGEEVAEVALEWAARLSASSLSGIVGAIRYWINTDRAAHPALPSSEILSKV